MIRASIRIGAIGMFGLASAFPAASQGMMQHVDLASPEMASAEMTRAEVEAAIASATALQPADLAGKKLSGLDLSGLDLSGAVLRGARSEEHTSELQSQSNLVCRLLLEKKKKKIFNFDPYKKKKIDNKI